jgi:hypothetical protein
VSAGLVLNLGGNTDKIRPKLILIDLGFFNLKTTFGRPQGLAPTTHKNIIKELIYYEKQGNY